MNIIKSSPNLTKKDRYKMIEDPAVRSISSIEEKTALKYESFILYTDINSDGDEVELLSIKCEEGVYATNSKTFIDGFKRALEIFDDDESEINIINVIPGKSKNNRTFYQCSID